MSWPTVALGEICTFMTGGTPSTKNPSYYKDGNIRWIVSGDIHQGEIFDCEKRITKEGMESSPAKFLPINSVLIALNGQGKTRGTVALLRCEATCNQSVVSIAPINEKQLDYNYLFIVLRSMYQKLRDITGDKNRTGLNIGLLKKIEIPLPPYAEQEIIADTLNKANALRQKREKAISLADNLLRSVFLDMFGDPIKNQKGWRVEKLETLSSKICSGSTPMGGSKVYVDRGTLFFRSQNVWRGKLELDDVVYIDKNTHRKMAKSSLKYGDLLITKTGRINTENSSLGRASIFLGEDDSANINGHVYLIRLKPKVINEFVLYILTTPEYRDYIRSVCVGGIDKRQINKEHLEQFPIIAPPLEAQQRFVRILQAIESQKESLARQLELANNMFSSLFQDAFSGELTSRKKAA